MDRSVGLSVAGDFVDDIVGEVWRRSCLRQYVSEVGATRVSHFDAVGGEDLLDGFGEGREDKIRDKFVSFVFFLVFKGINLCSIEYYAQKYIENYEFQRRWGNPIDL